MRGVLRCGRPEEPFIKPTRSLGKIEDGFKFDFIGLRRVATQLPTVFSGGEGNGVTVVLFVCCLGRFTRRTLYRAAFGCKFPDTNNSKIRNTDKKEKKKEKTHYCLLKSGVKHRDILAWSIKYDDRSLWSCIDERMKGPTLRLKFLMQEPSKCSQLK